MIVSPVHPDAANVRITGGKGASLARMVASGLPVPRTVVVSTEAWRLFFAEPELCGRIRALIKAPPSARNESYMRLRNAVGSKPFSGALRSSALEFLSGTDGCIACRSSAVVEDSSSRSFAGILSSHLGLPPTMRAFERGVKAVWLSLLAPRTLTYLSAFGLNVDDVIASGVAVVVQDMVHSERSGVLFRSPDHVRIEAIYGIGLPLVSGKFAPDVFEWCSGEWRREVQPYKRAALIPALQAWEPLLPGDVVPFRKGDTLHEASLGPTTGGLALVRLPYALESEPVLSDGECQRLIDLAHTVSERLDLPDLDLEWTWVANQPIVLQARPITTPLPSSAGSIVPSAYKGMGAAPGLARGRIWSPTGNEDPPDEPFVLLVPEVAPEHIHFVALARGVVALTGGMLCHGAILCRELGKPLVILRSTESFALGTWVEIDGAHGWVRAG